jgi:hypothetical protein
MDSCRHERQGPPPFLVPLAFVVGMAVARRHAWMRQAGGGGAGSGHPSGMFGHAGAHAGHGPFEAAATGHLPPKIEAILGAWHARAHASSAAGGTAGDTTELRGEVGGEVA